MICCLCSARTDDTEHRRSDSAAHQRSDVTSCGPLVAGPPCGMSPGCGRSLGDAGTSGAGAAPLRSAQTMGQQKTKQERYRNKVTYLTFVRSKYLVVTCMPGDSYRWRPRALSFVTRETFAGCMFLTQFVSILATVIRSPGANIRSDMHFFATTTPWHKTYNHEIRKHCLPETLSPMCLLQACGCRQQRRWPGRPRNASVLPHWPRTTDRSTPSAVRSTHCTCEVPGDTCESTSRRLRFPRHEVCRLFGSNDGEQRPAMQMVRAVQEATVCILLIQLPICYWLICPSY